MTYGHKSQHSAADNGANSSTPTPVVKYGAHGGRVLEKPLPPIADQGSFFAGGRTVTDKNGATTRADHLYAQYQKPINPRRYPLVLWHGGGETAKTWESTPDGREGYNTIFLRQEFSVYLVDQPGVGRGGKPAEDVTCPVIYSDPYIWELFRWGQWSPPANPTPTYYPDIQVSQGTQDADQYLKQRMLNLTLLWGPIIYEAGVTLFEAIGPAVLINHSAGGGNGWGIALLTDKVMGIVAYEPVNFVFVEGEVPPNLGRFDAMVVSAAEFKKPTRLPIQIVYGDNLDMPGTDPKRKQWWNEVHYGAEQFVAAVNRHGGDAQLLLLRDTGLPGHTHFPFSDYGNDKVADLLSQFLKEKGLDQY
ncbi:alpha/beta fold hydrolase [Chloroflexota bacterium]